MRSSSRMMARASLAVSLSPTVVASESMTMYVAISCASSAYSARALWSIFSCSPAPRIACSGPCAAALALPSFSDTLSAILPRPSGPGTDTVSGFPPSCLMRRATWVAWDLVSLRWSFNRLA